MNKISVQKWNINMKDKKLQLKYSQREVCKFILYELYYKLIQYKFQFRQ